MAHHGLTELLKGRIQMLVFDYSFIRDEAFFRACSAGVGEAFLLTSRRKSMTPFLEILELAIVFVAKLIRMIRRRKRALRS